MTGRRIINTLRLARRLEHTGFALAEDVTDSRIMYSRPSELEDLWEHIEVYIGGTRGDRMGAAVTASICYGGFGAIGLSEYYGVSEVTSADTESGIAFPLMTRLKDHEQAILWEQVVADHLPRKARVFAREVGSELLDRTADARAAVGRYVELFQGQSWQELRERLELRATSAELREAKRIADTPPTIQIRGGREFYVTLVLAIILHSDKLEGRQIAPPGVSPWPNVSMGSKQDWSQWQLAWRIEILADRLLGHYPHPMPAEMNA